MDTIEFLGKSLCNDTMTLIVRDVMNTGYLTHQDAARGAQILKCLQGQANDFYRIKGMDFTVIHHETDDSYYVV